ncbi:MAG: S41 family peptidase [Alphaproteobacteria bacterium]|nr:S41 family peptidase [Alphaproteobacteria bacterium]
MRLRRFRLLVTTLVVVIVAGCFSVLAQVSRPPSVNFLAREVPEIVHIGDVLLRVRDGYVDDVVDDALVEAAIRGIIATLDENSSYFTAEEYEAYQERSTGEFEGIGALVSWDEDLKAVRIDNIFDESPALRAGLRRGDRITQVDGRNTDTLDLQRAVEFIRGPAGSNVLLKIIRAEQELDVNVARGAVKSPVVTDEILDGDIMYVRLRVFNERSTRAIEDAVAAMRRDVRRARNGLEPRGMVLDLRNNPGGLLDQAIRITDLFLDRGLIVETRGRNGEEVSRASARNGQMIPRDMPLVILINQFSASASEIVSSALKAHGRATVVGVQSFGKGTVQGIHQFDSGAALRLTVARYFTAEGGSIDKVGVSPDIVVEVPEDFRVGDLDAQDLQLNAALSLLTS